jgi:hypothetical protein
MYTYQDILDKAQPHGFTGEGKSTRVETETYIISIVGGRQGLYGDFINTFEVAIIRKSDGEFVSGEFFPDYSDSMGQVMPHISKEQMLEVVNTMVGEVPVP